MACAKYPACSVFRPFNGTLRAPVKTFDEAFLKVLASPSLIWFSIEVAANVCPMASIHMIKFYQAVIKRPWTCLSSGRTVTALPTNNYCAKQLKSFCVSFFCCWMWQVVEKITVDAIQLRLNWDTGYFKILCFKGRQKGNKPNWTLVVPRLYV